jgi:DnaJ-class molecular chaperone
MYARAPPPRFTRTPPPLTLVSTRREESKVLTVTIKPGWKKGTKITFPCEGDEGPNQVPADVVFVLVESPHPR